MVHQSVLARYGLNFEGDVARLLRGRVVMLQVAPFEERMDLRASCDAFRGSF